MYKRGPDPISLLKMEDIINVFYILNRIKDNSYDQNYSQSLNNMPPIDRAENLIRLMSKNNDNMSKQNAEILINILKNIDLLNQGQYEKYRINSNQSKNSMFNGNDMLSKIKFFLKSLNDEE